MASNLTNQVRNIAEVTTAVAKGDLSRKITVDVRGEIRGARRLTINTMVDQLRSFASEVTRVAREVGTEGKLGGQADVRGVAGTWKDLTDSVNSMASNLTNQVRNIAGVTTAVANGDLSRKITVDVRGEILEAEEHDQHDGGSACSVRLRSDAGGSKKLVRKESWAGRPRWKVWRERGAIFTESVNSMASNLTNQVRNCRGSDHGRGEGRPVAQDHGRRARRNSGVEEHDPTRWRIRETRASFASEVTRVAREVGTEGKLGGQAIVRGVGGTWKDLTDSVNGMATNLTDQVRNIAGVTTAVANGNLSRKITVDARGEIQELKNTINTMVDQLNSFASEVTRVAREVGTEGKLGGQADVKGVAGTWKDFDRQRELHGGDLHDAGARDRQSGDGGGERRFEAQAGARNQGRDRGAGRHHQ